MIWNELSIVVV